MKIIKMLNIFLIEKNKIIEKFQLIQLIKYAKQSKYWKIVKIFMINQNKMLNNFQRFKIKLAK